MEVIPDESKQPYFARNPPPTLFMSKDLGAELNNGSFNEHKSPTGLESEQR